MRVYAKSLLVVVACSLISGDYPFKTFQTKTYGFEFNYPKTWVLENYLKNYGYMALFSPNAKNPEDKTFILTKGIKIELQISDPQEVSHKFPEMNHCNTLKNNNVKIKQYCIVVDDCLILYTPLKVNKQSLLIMAYIPFSEKLEEYKQHYNQLILSCKKIKSGSE